MKGYLWSPARIANSHQTPQRRFVFLSSFFGMIKAVGLVEDWSVRWQLSVKLPDVVWGVGTRALLGFVFTLASRLRQQQVKLLQIMARGQPSQLSRQCRLMPSAQSFRNSKFLSSFFAFIIPFGLSALYRHKMVLFKAGWKDDWIDEWSTFKELLLLDCQKGLSWY